MEKPRIRHIAINVENLDKTAEYYKRVFGMEEKHRRPGGTIYLSDGHLDLALIHTEKYPWGIHHFGFKVDSVKEIEKIADTKAEDNTYGAIAESWIKDVEAIASMCPSTAGRFDIWAGCLRSSLEKFKQWERPQIPLCPPKL